MSSKQQFLALATGLLVATTASAQSTLYSNGGFVTGVGNGFGGADTSEIEVITVGQEQIKLTAFGALRHQTTAYPSVDDHLADDFSVPDSKLWSLSILKWYGYQVGAAASGPSTITDVRMRVWDARPDQTGASVLFGDTTTNRLLSSSMTNCFRVRTYSAADPLAMLDEQRPIFELQIDMTWLPPLSTGTYWLDFMAVGDWGLWGPFSIPTVPWLATDNSAYFLPVHGEWRPTMTGLQAAPCDFPFELIGTELGLPSVYCTAKTNSQACIPKISSSGQASATSGSEFVVSSVYNLNGKPGLLLYGTTGQASTPFGGGILCVNGPLRRSITLNSGGIAPPPIDCTGVYEIDMNAFAIGALGGNPLPALTVPGTIVDCQFWGRDQGFPPPDNISLSDALEYEVGP